MKENTKEYYQTCITHIIAYIESNLEKNLRLDILASISNLSPYHFHRLFKAFTHTTIHDYIVRLRLERAAFLLTNTTKLISTIALECGYLNAENFTRAFQHYFSCSPSQFRSEQKEFNLKKENIIKSNSTFNISISAPIIKKIESIPIAYIRHQGAYDEVGETWKKLIKWGYKNWQLGWKPTLYGIAHDDPLITDEANVRYDACIKIKKEFTTQGEVGCKKIQEGTYAIFFYKGSYSNLNLIYDYIYAKWVIENNIEIANKPVFEHYINSPQRTKPANLKTEIHIPVLL